MKVLLQNVKKFCKEVKRVITPYFYALLFHKGRKTCSAMSRDLSISRKKIYESFKDAQGKTAVIKDTLRNIANNTQSNGEKRVLAIDGTMIMKAFAEIIQNLAFDYDGVTKRTTQGLSIIVMSLIIGENAFPLDFLYWKNAKKKKGSCAKNKNYKTKIEIAIELITLCIGAVLFDYIAMDGAFASELMIAFLESKNLKYIMRIARSRKVTINGLTMKLSEHPDLKLKRNARAKLAKGSYKGHECTFTVHKRKKKNGTWETYYLVSNMDLNAKEQVEAYSRRWPIDKSFRSCKQYLGLKDCQMLTAQKQTFHIFNVFLAYSLATVEKIAKGKKCVEDIFNELRCPENFQNFNDFIDSVSFYG